MYSVAVLGLLISLPLLVMGADSDNKSKKKDNVKTKLLPKRSSDCDLDAMYQSIENSWLTVQQNKFQKSEKNGNGAHNGHSKDYYDQDYDSEKNGLHADFEMIPLHYGKKTKKMLSPIHSYRAERLYKDVLKNTHTYENETVLDLSSANIKGSFNLGDITFEMRHLKNLNLDNNTITKLVGKIHRHTALKYFSATNNKLTFIKLSVFFTGFPNLKRLNVDHNQGLTIDSGDIVNITECTVSCKNCKLSEKDLASLAQNASYEPQRMPIENLFAARREREKPAYSFHTC